MRIFRLIATPILLLGLLGLLLWGASWGWKALTEPLPSPSPTPCVVGPAEVVTPADISVRVFNGGFTSGLANRVGNDLAKAGFTVLKVGNTEERIVGAVIRTSQSQSLQATIVASYFVEPTLDYDQRIDGTVDVFVGTDFLGMAPTPSPQATPPDGQACRAPSPSSSPGATDAAGNVTVSAATAGTKPVGVETYIWGTATGAPNRPVSVQVLVNNAWSTSQSGTTSSTGSYVLPLTYGRDTPGTLSFRVVVETSSGYGVSPTVTLTRTDS